MIHESIRTGTKRSSFFRVVSYAFVDRFVRLPRADVSSVKLASGELTTAHDTRQLNNRVTCIRAFALTADETSALPAERARSYFLIQCPQPRIADRHKRNKQGRDESADGERAGRAEALGGEAGEEVADGKRADE